MIYSVIEAYDVFENWEDFEPQYDTLELINGIKLQVTQLNKEEVKIVQVISSNPRDYMNKDLSPGKILKYKLQLE